MKKILIIGPSTKEAITDTRWCTAPLGAHYVASYLNANGHYAEVWDINLNGIKLEEKLKGNWDVISFSSMEATEEYDIRNICLAKKLSPDSLLVAGGTGPSLNYQVYFNKSPLDMVIQVEGEIPMLKLCKMIEEYGYNKAPLHMIDGLIIRRRAEILSREKYWEIRKCLDVKAMKASEYWKKTMELYDSSNLDEVNTFRLFTTSFCPKNCAFCTLTRLRKYACGKSSKVLFLNVDEILILIDKVLKEYDNVRQIFFVDDDFLLSKRRGIEFCKEVIERKKNKKLPDYLKFLCLTNIVCIDEENIDLLKEAGFRVLSIGVESTSQFVLDSLDKKQTVEQIWGITDLILSRGIKPYYTLILFAPDARVEDLVIDLMGFRRLGRLGAGLSIEPVFIPLKGTKFSEMGYPERVRKVDLDEKGNVLYKGFAWLPRNEEVYKIFCEFEKVYPKYRKWRFENDIVGHKEKNYQAYIILDCLEFVLMRRGLIDKVSNKVEDVYENLDKYKDLKVDIVGSFDDG